MNKTVVGVLLVIILAGGFFFWSSSQKSQNDTSSSPQAITQTNQTESSGETLLMGSESYIDYSPEKLAQATASENKVVLFFHANWCPTCKAANEAFISKQNLIPENVTILKTDYDTEQDLKQKYGITYQHTFVQIDDAGNEIAKWNGGDIEELKQNIK